jgi:hypothetical protein
MPATVSYPWPTSAEINGETVDGVWGGQTSLPATQANATAALAALQAMANPGPGWSFLVYRLSNLMWAVDTQIASGVSMGFNPDSAFTQTCLEVNRYLANPV